MDWHIACFVSGGSRALGLRHQRTAPFLAKCKDTPEEGIRGRLMFVKPRGLVSARCYLDGHDSCIAELCDCDCHVAKVEFRGENAEAATQTAYSGRCGQVIPLDVGT
jgi:hypothetical protein